MVDLQYGDGMMQEVEIGNVRVGHGRPVYTIAEVGINHDGNFDTAKTLILSAKESGASAVKLQTYITEKRVTADSPIFDILKTCELSFDEQRKLFDYAGELGIQIFSTPFDDESVDFLNDIGAPCFKIASFDIVNKDLLRRVAETGKPVVVSRGMADRDEIDTACCILRDAGAPIILLHCVSAYPVQSHQDLNLRTIAALAERYECPTGFSDHTVGSEFTWLAIAAGACIVEKHFTYSTKAEGADHAMSIDPDGFKKMIEGIGRVSEAMGEPAWSTIEAEGDIVQFRRPS